MEFKPLNPFTLPLFVFVWGLISFLTYRYLINLPNNPPQPISLGYPILAFTLFLLSYGLLIPLVKDFLPLDPAISGLALFGFIFFIFTLTLLHRLPFKNPLSSWLLGSFSYFLIYPFIFVLAKGIEFVLKTYFGIDALEQEAIQVLKTQKENFGLILFVTVFIPMIEEILFRGFLLQGLKSVMRTSFAIALSSLIFAFFHYAGGQGFSNITIIASLFALACFMGYLVEKTGSLWSSMGLHMTFNSISSYFIIRGLA